jgi:hypothetical protein
VVTAVPKGPSQINLTWSAVSNPGGGYIVEIESSSDQRYAKWQELRPIPDARGYTCDSSVTRRSSTCNISDTTGIHVYNLPTNGVPYWVTETTYVDPVDNSQAQFIVWGLRPNTQYHFRVRAYVRNGTATLSGPNSDVVSAMTANYEARYVAVTGNDANDGMGSDDMHAWRSLRHASESLQCGQVLIVKGGNYASDHLGLSQVCSAASRAVVLVNPGETAVITSVSNGATSSVNVSGAYVVIDGLQTFAANIPDGEYNIEVDGSHNALLNIETGPTVIPSFSNGVTIRGAYNLLYHSYLHDAGSPDSGQNPSGNSGWVFEMETTAAVGNVVWSNHLTRGGHDTSLCIRGCSHNRWLNNIFDGGWGMAWEGITNATDNLIEGNMLYHVAQLVKFYKPAIEISDSHNTMRRNISIGANSHGLEVSALYNGTKAVNNLIYNNVFYQPNSCYFQSRNGGVEAYDGNVFANNICYKFTGLAIDIYRGNTTNVITHNDILGDDANGNTHPGREIIIWNHSAEGNFQYPVTLADADKNYDPPFSRNKGLDVNPKFVDETNADFRLLADSPLIAKGVAVADNIWGTAVGPVDLGAFGIAHTSVNPK